MEDVFAVFEDLWRHATYNRQISHRKEATKNRSATVAAVSGWACKRACVMPNCQLLNDVCVTYGNGPAEG